MPGQMQRALEQLLSCAGTVSHKTLRFLKNDDVAASTLKPEIEGIYRSLGGILPSIPHFKLSHWDMEFDGIAVELDEAKLVQLDRVRLGHQRLSLRELADQLGHAGRFIIEGVVKA